MHGGSSGERSYDDDVAQVLEFCQDWLYLRPERGMDEEGARATVIEHVDVVIGAQHGIDGNGDGSYFDGAKEGCGELRGVEQQERDALFHLNTQVEEAIAGTVAEFRDLGVRVGRSLVQDGGFGTSSLVQVAIQESSCSVELFWYGDRR